MPIKQSNYILQALLLVIVLGCNVEKKHRETLVAKVGNSELTQNQLSEILNSDFSNSEKKEEVVRDWVETELLLQAATENKLLSENNYQKIIHRSERKLAAAFAIKNYLESYSEVITDKNLIEFYNKHYNNYLLPTDAYVLNYLSFNNIESAIKFRTVAVSKNWTLAKQIIHSENIIKFFNNNLMMISEIESKKLLRVLKELREKETSIVIETELSNFVVVQLLEKISKNEVPKLKYIKEKVITMYQAQINKELVSNYINSLTTKKNVKIY